jgi:prevent-host-death family protein
MAKTVTTTQARADLLELISEVMRDKQRIKITRRGKTVAALVPAEDLERIEGEDVESDKGQAKRIIQRIRSGKENTVPISQVRDSKRRK